TEQTVICREVDNESKLRGNTRLSLSSLIFLGHSPLQSHVSDKLSSLLILKNRRWNRRRCGGTAKIWRVTEWIIN
ncbi:hypothetical protein PFISCL1PPCAC_961, partial [Pristionchus fissidentatus]